MTFDLSEYVDVAERIALFKAGHPDGTLQSELQPIILDGALMGWYCKAFAYRTPGDERPGIGHAVEKVPGTTPYTRDSEAQNAETSAWGRAIVACGFTSKKIASAEEVLARQSGADSATEAPSPAVASSAGNAPGSPFQPPATPEDDGKPEHVVITFGKHKGLTLGQAPTGYRQWLVQNFEAKTPEQRRILAAAQALEGESSLSPADEDIPF